MGAKHQIRHATIKRGIDAYSAATGVTRDSVRVELNVQSGVVSFFATRNATRINDGGTESNPFEIEAARLRQGQAT